MVVMVKDQYVVESRWDDSGQWLLSDFLVEMASPRSVRLMVLPGPVGDESGERPVECRCRGDSIPVAVCNAAACSLTRLIMSFDRSEKASEERMNER